MTREERLAQLTESLRRHQDARAMVSSPVWRDLWNDLEQELLERLLSCDATDDLRRYRSQIAIQIARDIRRLVETKGVTPADLEREIGYLDGSKLRPVA